MADHLDPRPVRYMVFDVESIGLHGEAYAVGWVVVDGTGREMRAGMDACDPDETNGATADRAWVKANCPPLEVSCDSPFAVRQAFWREWSDEANKGAVLVADCAWPVEARFLAACIDDFPESRRWAGPYPLHDVASVRFAAGFDPLATMGRLPTEEPKHNPLADARQSARLFIQALRRLHGSC